MQKTEIKTNTLTEFNELIEEIRVIQSASQLSAWDMEINMPKAASEDRAWQMSMMSKICHEKLISKKTGDLLNELLEKSTLDTLNKTDKTHILEVKKEYDKAIKVPTKLVQELSETTAKAQLIWIEAKGKNNFSLFSPSLEKIISLKQKIADCIGYKNTSYDALLDDYEPGITASDLETLFNNLKKELIPLIQKIKESKTNLDASFIKQKYDKNKQLKICKDLLKYIGFDLERGHLAETTHPFTIGMGPNDVRLTTRTDENNLFFALGSTIHEGGHGIYEQGIGKELFKTFLYGGSSVGIHESQSRLYETIIGQGLSFWKFYFPILKNEFKDELKNISLESFYKGINKVEPSLIRVEADEVTYNIHIIIRFEIEKDLMENKIKVKDTPAIWNKKYTDYLGITPKNDSEGVLQDMHWSLGAIGYFPTYTIGNLSAAQIYNKIKKELPNIESEIEKGNFSTLKKWLRENIHKYGMLKKPKDLIREVTGEELKADYFINYIKNKYSQIYSLNI